MPRMSSAIRRFLRPVLVAVLLGAAATLAISWAASWYAPLGPSAGYMMVPGRPEWPVNGTVAVGVSRSRFRTDLLLDPGPYTKAERGPYVLYPPSAPTPVPPSTGAPAAAFMIGTPGPAASAEVPAPLWVRTLALAHAGERFQGWQARVVAFGWPLPALYWLWDWRTETLQGGILPAPANGAAPAISKPGVPDRAVPWRFLWINLTLDTIFYAAVLLLPYLLVRLIRHHLRRREGLCPRCAYDRSGLESSALCPECGTAQA